MPIWAFYTDEAVDLSPHEIPLSPASGETPLFTLTSLALPLAEWRNFDRDYLNLKRRFFRVEMDRSSRRDEAWEIKGRELCSSRNRAIRRNQAFITALLELCGRWNAMLFSSRMRRVNAEVATSYLSYVFGHSTRRQLVHLQEGPLFTDSHTTGGLQLADNIGGMIYANQYQQFCRGIEGAVDYSHAANYWPNLDALQFRSRDRTTEHLVKGIRVIDHRNKFGIELPVTRRL